MEDDFILNFATSNPAAVNSNKSSTSKQKGGRWTDRARDKRSSQQQVKPRTNTSSAASSTRTEGTGTGGGEEVKPKGSITINSNSQGTSSSSSSSLIRTRPNFDGGAGGEGGSGGSGGGGMIQPRQNRSIPSGGGTSNSTNSTSGGDSRGGPINKNVLGPGGKKQYISSLFTADGLPITTTTTSSKLPLIPSRPSNAPLRAPEQPEEEDNNNNEEEEPIASTSTIPELLKAPLLASLGLNPQLVSHLVSKLSITGPTACQAGAIPPLLAGNLPLTSSTSKPLATGNIRARDAILQAQTGSGKTLAFLLPLLQDLLTLNPNLFNSIPGNESGQLNRSIGTLAIILAPTRELASQIYTVLESLLSLPSPSATTTFTVPPRSLTPCLLVGGANRTHEKSRLRKGCPIIVATPGRLLDHLRTTESFKLAGEPLASKGPRGRGNGVIPGMPGTGANYGALGKNRGTGAGGGRALGLRWLIIDECDRLMDLGFEEQMKGILVELERRSPSTTLDSTQEEEGRRRTILCSATASEGVDRLAGMALRTPVLLRASSTMAGGMVVPNSSSTTAVVATTKEEDTTTKQEEDTTTTTGEVTTISTTKEDPTSNKISFTPPTQLVHNYVICPPKLRFVGLIALLRRILNSPSMKKGPGSKILVFLSSTDAVNFYWEAMGSMGMGSTATSTSSSEVKTNVLESAKDKSERLTKEALELKEKLISSSPLLPNVPIYRLHGNLDLAKRLGSLKAFSHKTVVEKGKDKGKETENAILLCTSVAARGLDVPFVSHVVQFDLPTEGGVTEYIHRVGRTARAGASGQATAFLLPTESSWVPWVESGMKQGSTTATSTGGGGKEVKLREIGIEEILKDGFGGSEGSREFETRATDVQMGFERWVSENEEQSTLARNAFASHIRAYATHPHSEKSMFNTKSLHLGHLAKSFGMREAPSHTSGSNLSKSSKKKIKSTGRETTLRTIGAPQSEREKNDRAIASLPVRQDRSSGGGAGGGGGFETGRRHNEERANKRQRDQMMQGPKGDGAGEFQVASTAMLESLASGKRLKR